MSCKANAYGRYEDMEIVIRKTVPVVAEVDVVVAGGGIAGCVAAVAAARGGARTLLVESFGTLGGNMGPGMFSGGVLHLSLGMPSAMHEGLAGIPGEFIHRCEGYTDGQLGHEYFRDSQVVSHIWLTMMKESGVELLLNTRTTDPVLEDRRVVGLTVENKSGTQIIKAAVVVDATGDADVVFRAGGLVDSDDRYMHPGMFFAIRGVEREDFLEFRGRMRKASDETLNWARGIIKEEWDRLQAERKIDTFWSRLPDRLCEFLPLFKKVWDRGEYRWIRRIDDRALVSVDHGFYQPRGDIIGAQVGIRGVDLHSGDAFLTSRLESETRLYIFETAQFLRRHVPGFASSHLHMISPYFHYRGGRSAVTEHPLTEQEIRDGSRHDDVVFVHYGSESIQPPPDGNDFPYRQLLPKDISGLLVTGRSAIIQPPTMRDRWKIFMMGQVAGTAAAIAVGSQSPPSEIDVRELQRELSLKYHVSLGSRDRATELGIS